MSLDIESRFDDYLLFLLKIFFINSTTNTIHTITSPKMIIAAAPKVAVPKITTANNVNTIINNVVNSIIINIPPLKNSNNYPLKEE